MSTGANHCDILIIGEGITGLSTAHHLLRQNNRSMVIAAGLQASTSWNTPGMICGGQFDNLTRVAHAHGPEFAADLWRFGDAAFDQLQNFCNEHEVALKLHRRLRLITSYPELLEARKVVAHRQASSLGGVLIEDPNDSPWGSELHERALAIQDDGERGGFVHVGKLRQRLSQQTKSIRRIAPVVRLTPQPTGMLCELSDGSCWNSEIVVLAAHLNIGNLLPNIKSALVSVADQWGEVVIKRTAKRQPSESPWSQPGIVFSANHAYEWGVSLGADHFILGGGRYLRKWAGIEAEKAEDETRISKHLEEQFQKTFNFLEQIKTLHSHASLDCRPCDELPIIGPMYGEPRILLATGYMGQGLTQGFLAGQCLADLITHGSAPALPRRLWPERLRSLKD